VVRTKAGCELLLLLHNPLLSNWGKTLIFRWLD